MSFASSTPAFASPCRRRWKRGFRPASRSPPGPSSKPASRMALQVAADLGLGDSAPSGVVIRSATPRKPSSNQAMPVLPWGFVFRANGRQRKGATPSSTSLGLRDFPACPAPHAGQKPRPDLSAVPRRRKRSAETGWKATSLGFALDGPCRALAGTAPRPLSVCAEIRGCILLVSEHPPPSAVLSDGGGEPAQRSGSGLAS